MGNIVDYIRWRGDLSFESTPINDIDELIFAELMYGIFEGILDDSDNSLSVKEVAEKYLELHPDANYSSYEILDTTTYGPYVLMAMANSNRYKDVRLSNYIDIFDEAESIQYASFVVTLSGNIKSLVFRGTDATIDGWREDFAISFSEVGAQKLAVDFLDNNIKEGYTYYISGHSKGGNLAEYSAMNCRDELKPFIKKVYSFDGPGICPEMMNETGYELIKEKIVRIAPDFSVVGMLFRKDYPDIIVKSKGSWLLQHAAFTWEIEGNHFVAVDELDPVAREMDKIIDEWIDDESLEERQAFTKGLFDSFKAGGAIDVHEIAKGGVDGIRKILLSLASLDKEAKGVAVDLAQKAVLGIEDGVRTADKKTVGSFLLNLGVWYAAACILVGVFFLALPSVALKLVGIVFFLQVIFFSIFQIVISAIKKRKGMVARGIVYGLLATLGAACLVRVEYLPFSSGILIGVMFLVMCGVRIYNGIIFQRQKQRLYGVMYADAGFSLILAILSFALAGNAVYIHFLKPAGIYLVIMSMIEFFRDYVVRELKVYKV